jgi:hypothetical protein
VIAQRYGHDPDWVKARLRRADGPLRAPGRQATTDEDRVRSLLDHGLRVPPIADALDCSTTPVLTIMRKHGWVGPPRRPRGPNRIQPPTPDPAVLRRLYVDEGLSIGGSASERSPSACTCRRASCGPHFTPRASRSAGQGGLPARRRPRSAKSNCNGCTSTRTHLPGRWPRSWGAVKRGYWPRCAGTASPCTPSGGGRSTAARGRRHVDRSVRDETAWRR